jgi:Domain of unknown function (DUF4340)
MKLRNLFIATFVLAALCGVLYWSNHRKPVEEPTKAATDTPPKILSLDQAAITRFEILRKAEPSLAVSKDASGSWQIISPKSFAADQDAVLGVLSAVSSLNADRLIDDKATDLSSYGLAAPSLTLQIATKDGKTQSLLIGDQTPTSSGVYAALAGDPRVFTVATTVKSSIDKSVNDLRDKRLLTADFDKVTQIELLNQSPAKKQDITFGHDKDAWQILKPKPARAENFKVEDLIRSLKDAKLDIGAAAEDAKSVSAFNSASPFVIIKITGASGTQELQIRKSKDDYYASSSVVPGVFKIASTVATPLDKSLDDFLNKKLFDFGFQDPNKIEVHDADKSYALTRSGSDWWGPDGKKLDPATVQPLVEKLRDLSAEKFPDSGFTSQAIQITITSNDTKTTEGVAISKSGDSYIAKRENESELYEISAASIADIQQAAAGLKAAAAPAAPAAAKK